LLSEGERKLFARLSVFAGGWTLEAAEAVGAGSGIEEEDILDLLSQLVDKSLVMAEMASEGAPRLRMLEPVRQYAHEKLGASEEADKLRRQHAVWFLGVAEEAESELSGAQQGEWMDTLEVEHDNLRVVLSWSLHREEPELGLRLAVALRWFWYARGYLSEGRRWLEEALSRYDVSFSPGASRLGAVTNARLFATKYRPPRLKLFSLEEALRPGGWLKALGLEGYSPRSRGKPGALQGALFSYLDAH
jgi:predicted ATPase